MAARFKFPVSDAKNAYYCCCKNVACGPECVHVLDGIANGTLPVTAQWSADCTADQTGCCASQLMNLMTLSLGSYRQSAADNAGCTCNYDPHAQTGYFAYQCFNCAAFCNGGGGPGPWGLYNAHVEVGCICDGKLTISAGWIASDFSAFPAAGATFDLIGNGAGTYVFAGGPGASPFCGVCTNGEWTVTLG